MNLPEQKNSADFTQAIRTSKIEKIPTDEAAKRMKGSKIDWLQNKYSISLTPSIFNNKAKSALKDFLYKLCTKAATQMSWLRSH